VKETATNTNCWMNNIKSPQCKKCDNSVTNRSSLETHNKQHKDHKPYACPDCEKLFSNMSILAVRMEIDIRKRPYHCARCGEGFILSNHMKRHIKNHAGKTRVAGQWQEESRPLDSSNQQGGHFRTIVCSKCGKGFVNMGSLCVHQKHHVDSQPYSCTDW
jgi:KRAB domain-containing zinc finger protein